MWPNGGEGSDDRYVQPASTDSALRKATGQSVWTIRELPRMRLSCPGNPTKEKNLNRLDSQAVNTIKMAAVIAEEGKIVLECSGGDHEIHVAYALTNSPKAPAFAAESLARLLINTQNG
jgi:hypothetical protein